MRRANPYSQRLLRCDRADVSHVDAMAVAGAEVAQRGQDKHLHYSRGVTVEEMRGASIPLMQLVPTDPTMGRESRDEVGTRRCPVSGRYPDTLSACRTRRTRTA